MKRTHTCNDLTKHDKDKVVILNGWVDSVREHGKIVFINLRDRYGKTQVTIEDLKTKLGNEDVIAIKGKVQLRPKSQINESMKTGEVEVLATELKLLSKSIPLPLDNSVESSEDNRLKYRYIDLRKPSMQQNLITRHKLVKAFRDYLDKENFLEIETPILAKSTPEGARDYLVPSRVNKGQFYALPQSPQIFKQILMIAGYDKYFQVARCFRDEDLRADRQPEFTQLDIEMSFIDEEDIYYLVENMFKHIWKTVLGRNIETPIKRMTYQEAMEKYGSDKPDIRFKLYLNNVTDLVKNEEFKVFAEIAKNGGTIKCLNIPQANNYSRKDIEELEAQVKRHGAKGLAYIKHNGEPEGPIVKFLKKETITKLFNTAETKRDDMLVFVADHKHKIVNDALGNLRNFLAKKLNLYKQDTHSFLWVTDFPLVEYDEDMKRHQAVHHPFTMMRDEDLHLLDKHPEKIRAKAYDLTLNGTEIGGGSIRIHDSEIQRKVFNLLNINDEQAKMKFGFLLDALKCGTPPHGGLAFGIDRISAIITNNESIREVIAFPKNKNAQGLMDNCPSDVDQEQLDELNLKLK